MAKKRKSISARVSDAAARLIDGDGYQPRTTNVTTPREPFSSLEISEGSGNLFDVPQSNLDDGTRFSDAYQDARVSALGPAGGSKVGLSELRRRKWEKAEEARVLVREVAYARGAAQAPSVVSGIHPLILLAIGWILLSLALVALGYESEPSRRSDPPYTQTDPTHPCYGLTAQECKWN